MSEEPFYIRQAEVDGGGHAKRVWFDRVAAEARAEGATFFRASVHPDIENLVLLEGWKTQPENQGELRWSLTAQ